MSWLRFTLSSKGRLEAEKLAMDTRTFFHGSPEDLETLELRVPPNHTAKGVPGEAAVYAAESPIAAALYALARNSSKGSWGVSKDNRLIMKSTKELNPFGYVYELESSDYTSPPEDNLALGFAVKDPKIKSKKLVSAAELQEYIDRVETTEELLQQMGLSKTSSARGQLEHFLYKRASLEDTFTPDFTPDDLRAFGVYDQVYGDAPREASMKEWPAHWINEQDPLGWLQWYERYSGGRRTEDDARQIKRWNSFKARHLAQYLKNPTPRRAAALRNWGIDVEKHK
jgi:hypothetical protein